MKIEDARRVTIDFSGPPELLQRLVTVWSDEYTKIVVEAQRFSDEAWRAYGGPEPVRIYPPTIFPVTGTIRFRLKPKKDRRAAS